jgi:hypothetical protein
MVLSKRYSDSAQRYEHFRLDSLWVFSRDRLCHCNIYCFGYYCQQNICMLCDPRWKSDLRDSHMGNRSHTSDGRVGDELWNSDGDHSDDMLRIRTFREHGSQRGDGFSKFQLSMVLSAWFTKQSGRRYKYRFMDSMYINTGNKL